VHPTVTATFIRLRPIPFAKFTMKRGAERQLTRDEFEDGDVEPEARLADPDEKSLAHLSQHIIVNVRYRFQKSSRRNFENQSVRDYLLQYLSEFLISKK
jgi:NUP50 (Nucleoporin 50 kDa)